MKDGPLPVDVWMGVQQHRMTGISSAAVTLCVLVEHTHTQPFNGLLSGTTRVGRYQKKHSPTHTHPEHRTSFITFLHLQRSMASSLCVLVEIDY